MTNEEIKAKRFELESEIKEKLRTMILSSDIRPLREQLKRLQDNCLHTEGMITYINSGVNKCPICGKKFDRK